MANYKEYAKRIVNAIKRYGEKVYVKTRTSDYDIVEGETYTYKRYKNFKCFYSSHCFNSFSNICSIKKTTLTINSL